jgi:RimJ/RimL family protein N-acetyltransferase
VAELCFPDPPLTDGVIALRAWTRDDIEFVVEACQDPEVTRYSPAIPFPYTEADALGWLENQEPTSLAGKGVDFAVTRAATGELFGAIGLNNVSEMQMSATTGYWLARRARGHGYISRALRILARWAFDDLELARLELTADPENVASQRVAERCGFRKEGQLRSHTLVRHTGQRRDSLVYGLLPGELIEQTGGRFG